MNVGEPLLQYRNGLVGVYHDRLVKLLMCSAYKSHE